MADLRMTDKRRRALQFLEQHGRSGTLEIAEVIAPRKYGWSPQGACRWTCGYMTPLWRAGLVSHHRGHGGFCNYYEITVAGRDAARKAADG